MRGRRRFNTKNEKRWHRDKDQNESESGKEGEAATARRETKGKETKSQDLKQSDQREIRSRDEVQIANR